MNNSHVLESLCKAEQFVYAYKNDAKKDEGAFVETVEMFKQANTITFNSMITNEEAMILQVLKEKHGYKLVNKETKKFQTFLSAFGSISGHHLYGADLNRVENSDFSILIGCSVSSDNPMVRASLESAHNQKDAYSTYMHPLEDEFLESMGSQHIKHEVGSEEGLVAMLADLVVNTEGKEKYKSFFNALDDGYICGESSVGEEEFNLISEKLLQHKKHVLVVGSDVFNHPRANNIAKILGMISKYSSFEVFMITPEVNSLGVALICELDEVTEGKTVGYNVKADYTLSFLGDGDLDMPSLSQQEGTWTSLDKKVLALNAATAYEGYTLNDIANALGVQAERSIDYTAKLPVATGYKAVAFDGLENSGYTLENVNVKIEDETLEDIDDIPEFNGTVIYRCNHPLSQLNLTKNEAHQIKGDLEILGSKQFATVAKMSTDTMVRFEMDGKTYERKLKVSENLKGTVAYNPVFDSTENYDEYRYKRVKLEEVNE